MFFITNDYYQIRRTLSRGRGVFVKKTIKQKTIIGEYTGTKVEIEKYDLEKDKEGLYLMFLDDKYAIYPDLKTEDIHLVNHSCDPNCWILNSAGRVFFFALREIEIGEELTISYLLPPKDNTCNSCSHDCYCESIKCTKTMHQTNKQFEKWQDFQENLNIN